MYVAYFQIAIIVSTVGAWMLTRNKKGLLLANMALIVAVAWSIETILMVYTSKLLLVQFFTIWGTWFVLQKLTRQSRKIQELESALEGVYPSLPPNSAQAFKNTPKSKDKWEIIKGRQHLKALESIFGDAQSQIIIASGWVTDWVVTQEFSRNVESSIKRGVNIRLIFGHHLKGSEHSRDRALNQLIKIRNNSISDAASGNLLIFDVYEQTDQQYGTHAKALVCDEKYAICGSHNWLSNNLFKSAEISVKVKDMNLVQKLAKEFENLMAVERKNKNNTEA